MIDIAASPLPHANHSTNASVHAVKRGKTSKGSKTTWQLFLECRDVTTEFFKSSIMFPQFRSADDHSATATFLSFLNSKLNLSTA